MVESQSFVFKKNVFMCFFDGVEFLGNFLFYLVMFFVILVLGIILLFGLFGWFGLVVEDFCLVGV